MALLCAALMAGAVGCGGTEDGAETDNGVGEDGETATVTGRLQAESEADGEVDFSTTIVTAYRVDSAGDMTLVSDGETTAEADGRYEVRIDLSIEAHGDLMIEAQREDEVMGSVLIGNDLTADAQVQAAPISTKTTVESDAYVQATSSGHWNQWCTISEHRELISGELAAQIRAEAEAEYDAQVEAVGAASSCAMQAWSGFLLEKTETSESQIRAVFEAQADARAEFDAALHAGADAEASAETYSEAVAKAYADTGISIEEQALAAHASAEGMIAYFGDLSTEARARAEADAEARRASYVTKAVELHAQALGYAESSTEFEAMVDARAELEAAITASTQGRSEIRAAWESYREAIAESFSEVHFAAFSALELSADAQAKLAALGGLEASAQSSTTAAASVEAVAGFYQEVMAIGETIVDGMVDAGAEVEAHALLSILFHLELCAR
ncbi:MAG: hypothetical protein ACNA8W_06960 [Bradymonadaceae bacterium]